MPRQRRKKGEYNTYHIIQRGNERKNIFLFDEDRERFIETLLRMKEKDASGEDSWLSGIELANSTIRRFKIKDVIVKKK